MPSELRDHPSVRSGQRLFRFAAAAIVLGYPWVMSPSQTNLGALYAIYAVIGISLVVLSGWGGQISLGQFAFVRPFQNPEAGWMFQFSLVAPL